jgi:uncharacterized membrane protein YccF (DUF307 family)
VALLRFVANVVWLVFAGLPLALGYAIAGVIAFILIVTIPFGIASFRLASYTLWPFGRAVVDRQEAGAASVIGNVIWFVVAGWWLALGHLVSAVALFVSIIGIPFGIVSAKMAVLAVFPLGKQVVPADSVEHHAVRVPQYGRA